MTSQTPPTTCSPVPSTRQSSTNNASKPPVQRIPLTQKHGEGCVTSRPRPAHTKSAPTLAVRTLSPIHSHGTTLSSSQPPSVSATGQAASPDLERPVVARSYTAHLPHNPNRPPPYTYQRQHEFPPFPPLAQHPVLPFLTTAFSNQPDVPSATAHPPKARPIVPRAATTQRHVHSTLSTIPTMDVSKNDPTAIFIRPPLVVPLPRNADPSVRPAVLSGIATDGTATDAEPAPGTPVTYAILHAHRNWFLDADDFRKDNPNRIDYPPDLEPPRGWAPLPECTGPGAANRCKQAKEKKERTNAIRTKGSYAHAENALTDTAVEYGPSDDCHEKTVLRCTFCRREYHGPNAKSMWRRHVFDKHKVAMKNRREGSAGMAPKVSLPKKAKTKVTHGSPLPLSPPVASDTPALTLDLSNERNLIRLLERVVSGGLDISIPASLLNPCSSSDGGTHGLDLQSIALALQRGGISVTMEKGTVIGSGSEPSRSSDNEDSGVSRSSEEQQKPAGRSVKVPADSAPGMMEHEELSYCKSIPSTTGAENVARAIWVDEAVESSGSDGSLSPPHPIKSTGLPLLASSEVPHGRKRKAEDTDRDGQTRTLIPWDRAPLKDNTALDRNNHNSIARVIPKTPRKDKGKQKALPCTPNAPRMSQTISPPSSPRRNPYTPHHPSALRAQGLATTGEESYLTLVLSSPATASPIRSTGRISFTSPFFRRTSPTKPNDRDFPPTSDGALGVSSPRYPFDFSIQGTHDSSSYMTAFDSIPLELGELAPTHWTPLLGPPAPVSEPTSRALSRANSLGDDIDVDEDAGSDEDDRDMELKYPVWSSPSERLQRRRSRHDFRSHDEDFDMDVFLDLEDAGPALASTVCLSPHKGVAARGFSKEFGLLSSEEVERITASAHPSLEKAARSPKRQRLDCSP